MAVMYQTEVYSGSTKRYFDDVLRFELFELGNVHILHELIQNELVSNSDLIAQMKNMAEEWDRNGYVDDMSESDQIEFVEKLRQELSAQVGQDIQYALWLADKVCVQGFYGGRDSDIECYETSNVILSDLGQRGILFEYEFEPFPFDI